MANRTYATNKRARFDYEIQDTLIAGLVLHGHEVKSIRAGNVQLNGAYVTISEQGEAWLLNAYVKKYEHASNIESYDAERSRKLLLNKSELERLKRARDDKLVLLALSLHAAGPNIKLSLGIGKPKKLHDKRQTIRRRDTERGEMRQFKGN